MWQDVRWIMNTQVVLFSDFHGHSRKPNIFSYGCGKKPNGGKDWAPVWPGSPVPGSVGGLQDIPVRFQGRLLPLLMQYSAPDLFSYQYCTVKVQKSKAGTSRVVVFRELGLTNSFTLEASIAGPNMGRDAGHHFSTKHLESMGAALASALADYWDPLSYGIPELINELEALHAVNGDLEQNQPDAEDSTDSDDEPSSDEAEALADMRGQKQGKSARVRRGPTKSQLKTLSREYAERAAAGLMDVLSNCTAQQQPQQQLQLQQQQLYQPQHLPHPQQQEQQQQLQPPYHKRTPMVTFANSAVASSQPQQATQVLYPPEPLLGGELQEVAPPPLLPHLQGSLYQPAVGQHQPHLPAPGKLSLPAQIQGPAMALRPTPRDLANPQIHHPIQQVQHQQQHPHQLHPHSYLVQQHYLQQQQHLQAVRAQADIEYFRSMEHLRARGIYRGDTMSWANAPGRLSSTNVSLNIQQAEREREVARQKESLEGWDSIFNVGPELHPGLGGHKDCKGPR
ncbi:hypothetical protein DUNSADRAFT_14859 [Dunaliella salina]|uniref:Peptidase M14 domain-containing protein n=1 Tax=Dunaliella salina TaxID=3046 RepID=A0ABQ7H2H3_DUNSA|nr:hypothetical protein DUNSADRAFT_14859 [Dunaliella salina]|eukprot:KAF5841003.1 hypothetical protein DUNSADRAFT_14859 [Dunaliella salina]